jgi:hypothetical protein
MQLLSRLRYSVVLISSFKTSTLLIDPGRHARRFGDVRTAKLLRHHSPVQIDKIPLQIPLLFLQHVSSEHIPDQTTSDVQWHCGQGECDVSMCLTRKGRRFLIAYLFGLGFDDRERAELILPARATGPAESNGLEIGVETRCRRMQTSGRCNLK